MTPVAFAGTLIGAAGLFCSNGENCESIGLALYLWTIPSIGVGAVAGGIGGALRAFLPASDDDGAARGYEKRGGTYVAVNR